MADSETPHDAASERVEAHRLGIDTGGTFTDFVLLTIRDGRTTDVRVHKRPSTPDDPARAVLEGLRALGLDDPDTHGTLRIVHGTTVATNAALEGQGARTLLVTDEGLEDLLAIGRQARPELYRLAVPRDDGPAATAPALGVPGRLDANGRAVAPLTEADVARALARARAEAPEAIAVCLLFSWIDPAHEQLLGRALADLAPVTLSSELLPETGEYERALATWLNAWLTPRTGHYLERLRTALEAGAGGGPRLEIMHSAGGTYPVAVAERRPARLILSGPAGGLTAARALARETGLERLLTFDMGGTSTDVGLFDGEVALTTGSRVGPFPLALPMFDLHTIGAGGGSLAEADPSGVLRVGPRSAGADPGPACYGRGGAVATVTDAHVVLGRLPEGLRLAGGLPLDAAAAHGALGRLGAALGLEAAAAARGVIDLANEHMAAALRVVTLERGVDPRDFTLTCFGGAGGLHLCELGDALGITRALVPRLPGALSALGLTQAVPERQLSRTVSEPLPEGWVRADGVRAELEASGRGLLREAGVPGTRVRVQRSADLRYAGQTFTLNVPWDGARALAERFAALHEQRYGHALDLPVECLNVRVRIYDDAPAARLPPWPEAPTARPVPELSAGTPAYRREDLGAGAELRGPSLVVEETATTWIAEGWTLRVDARGHLRLERPT